jgi:hypothetical protein
MKKKYLLDCFIIVIIIVAGLILTNNNAIKQNEKDLDVSGIKERMMLLPDNTRTTSEKWLPYLKFGKSIAAQYAILACNQIGTKYANWSLGTTDTWLEKYRWGEICNRAPYDGRRCFDCAGLAGWCAEELKQKVGPHNANTYDEYSYMIEHGIRITDVNNIRAGMIGFTRDLSHVVIAVSNGNINGQIITMEAKGALYDNGLGRRHFSEMIWYKPKWQ